MMTKKCKCGNIFIPKEEDYQYEITKNNKIDLRHFVKEYNYKRK